MIFKTIVQKETTYFVTITVTTVTSPFNTQINIYYRKVYIYFSTKYFTCRHKVIFNDATGLVLYALNFPEYRKYCLSLIILFVTCHYIWTKCFLRYHDKKTGKRNWYSNFVRIIFLCTFLQLTGSNDLSYASCNQNLWLVSFYTQMQWSILYSLLSDWSVSLTEE